MRRRDFVKLTSTALTFHLARPLLALPDDNPYFNSLGLQLWTVRNQLAEDRKGTIKAIADAGYKQVEIGSPDDGELITLANDHGMQVTSSFIDWEVLGNPECETIRFVRHSPRKRRIPQT